MPVATRHLDRFSSQIVTVHTTALLYTTLLNINPLVYGSSYQLGLRARGVYRNVGVNTGYGGYCETVAGWTENGLNTGSNISGNINALGGPTNVGGLAILPVIFVDKLDGTIDVKGSGLDGDSYKWFVSVAVEVLQVTP